MSSSTSPQKSSPAKVFKPLIAYVHNVSNVHHGKKCAWFDMELQTENKRVRAVCFTHEKRSVFLEKQSTITPVKLTNYILGQAWNRDGEEILINQMTIVQSPASSEYNFQYIADENSGEETTELCQILSTKECGASVNVKGKIKKGDTPQTVGKKSLKMLKCVITDGTVSLPISIWQDEIDVIEDGCVYIFTNVTVKLYNQVKSLSTNFKSNFVKKENDVMQHLDDSSAVAMLSEPTDTTVKVNRFRSVNIDKFKRCVECLAKFPPAIETKIVKCLRCAHRMRFEDCKQTVACRISVVVVVGDSTIVVTAFSEAFETILDIKDLCALSEDKIAERLLELERLKISFDNDNIVTKITRGDF